MSIHCQCFELLYHSNKFNDVGGSVRITSNFSVKKGSIGKICHLKVVNVYSIQKQKEDIEAFMDELRDIGCIECAVTECVNKCACDAKTNPAGLRDPDSSVLHQLAAFSELMGLMFGKQYVALCRVSIEEEESTPLNVARNQASSEVVVKRPKPTVHYGILVNGRVNSKGTLLVDTLNKVVPLFVRSASPMMVGSSSSSSALLSPVLAEERSVDSTNSSDCLEGHTAFQKLCKNWLTIGRITLSRKSPQSSPAQLTLTSKKTFAAGGVGSMSSSSSSSNTPVTQMSQLPSGRHVAKVSSAESTSHRLSRCGSIYSGNVVTSSGGSSASVLTQSKISPSVPAGAGNSGSNGISNSRKQLNLVTKLRTSLPPRNSRGLQALQSQLRADSPDVVMGSMGDARQAVPRPKNDFLQTIRRSGSFTSNSGGLDLLASPATFSAGDSTPGTDTTPLLQSHFAGPSSSSPLLTPADSISSTVMPMETDCSVGYFTDNDANDANDFHDAHNSDAGNINSLRTARNNTRDMMMHNTSSSSIGAPPLTSKALATLPHSFAASSSTMSISSSQFITPKKFAHSHHSSSQRGIAMEANLSASPRDDQHLGEDEEATLRAMAASEADVDMSINDADISFLNKMGFSGDVSPIFGSAALSTPLSASSFSPYGRSMDALNANPLADNITSGGDSEQLQLLHSPTRGEWRYSGKEEVNEEYTRDADDETNTRPSFLECGGAEAHLNKSLDMNRTQQKRKKAKRDGKDREIGTNAEKEEQKVEGEGSEAVVAKEDKRRSRRRITPIAVLDVPLLRYGDAALSSQSSVSCSIAPPTHTTLDTMGKSVDLNPPVPVPAPAPLFSAAVPCELSNMYVSASSAPSSGSRSAGGTSSRILRSQSSLSHGGGTKRGLSQSSATSSGSSAGKNLFGGVFGSMIANAPRLSEVNCKSSSTSGSTSSRSGGSSSGGSGGVHSSGSQLTASESNSRFTRPHQSPETLASRIDASSVCGAAAASSLLSAVESTCSSIVLPVETAETGADDGEDDHTCATVKEEDLLYQEMVAEDPFGGPDSYNTSQVSCSGSLLHLPHLQQAGSSRSMDIETAGTTLESQSAAGIGAALSNGGTEAAPSSSNTRVLRRRVTSSGNVSVVPPAGSNNTAAKNSRVVLRSRRSLSTNTSSVSSSNPNSNIVIHAPENNYNQCDSNTFTEVTEQQTHQQQHCMPSVSVDESSRLVFESFLSNNTMPFGLNSAVMPIVQQQQLPKTRSTLSDSISGAAVVAVSAKSGPSVLGNPLNNEATAIAPGPRDVSVNDNNSSAISVAGSESVASGALVAQADLATEKKAEQTSGVTTALSEYQSALNKLPAPISSLLGDCVLRRLTHPVVCALQLVRQLMSLSAAAAEKMLDKLDSTPNDKSSSSSVSKSSGKPNDKPSKGNQSTSSKKSGSGSGGGSVADKRLCCDAIVTHLCKHLLNMLKKIRIGGLSQGTAAYSALCVILAVFPTHYYCELLSRSKQSVSSSSGDGGGSTGAGAAVLKKLKSFASYAGAFETAMGRCKLALGSWCLVDADKVWVLTLPTGNTSDSAAVTVTVSGTEQNNLVSKDKRKRSVDNLNNTIIKSSSSDATAGQPTSTPSGPNMQVLIDFLKTSYAPCTALYDRIKESIRTRDVAQLLLDTPVKAVRPAKKARGGGGGLSGVDEEVEMLFAEVADGTSGEGVAASLGGALLMENASNNSQSSQNTQQSVLLHDNYVVSDDVAPDTSLTAAAAAGTVSAGNVHIASVGTRSSVSAANLLPTGTTTSSGGTLSDLNSLCSVATNTATSAVLPGMKSSLKRTNSILGESGSRRHVNHRMQMGEQKRVSVANPASITSAHHKVASNLLSHTKTNSVGNSTNNSNSNNSNTLSSPVRSSSRHANNRQFTSASLLSPSVVFDTQMSPGTVRRSGSSVNCVADTPFEQQGGGYRKKRPATAEKSGRSSSSSSSFKKSPLFSPGMLSSPLTAAADRAAEQQHMVFGSPKFEQDLDAEEESDQQLHSAATGDKNAARSSERSALFDENETEHLSARKKQKTNPLPVGDSSKPVVKSVAKSAAIPIRVPIKVPAKRLHGGGNSSPLPVKIAAPVLPLLPSGRKRGQHAGLKELVSLAPSSQSSSSISGGELSQLSQTLSLSVTPGRCTRSQRGIAELSPQGTTPGAVTANTPINTSTDTLGHTPSGTSTTPSCRLTRSASKLEIGCSPPLQPTPLTTDSSVGGVYSSVNSNASTSVGGSVSIDIVRSPVVPSLDTQSPPPTSPHSARSSNHTNSACNNSMLPPAPKKKARSPDYLLSNSAAVAAADPQMQPPSSGLRPPMGRRKPGF